MARDSRGQGTGLCPPTYELFSHTGQGHFHTALHLEYIEGPVVPSTSHPPPSCFHSSSACPRLQTLPAPAQVCRALLPHHQQTAGALSPHHWCPDGPYPAYPVRSLPTRACAPGPGPCHHLCLAAQSRHAGKERMAGCNVGLNSASPSNPPHSSLLEETEAGFPPDAQHLPLSLVLPSRSSFHHPYLLGDV